MRQCPMGRARRGRTALRVGLQQGGGGDPCPCAQLDLLLCEALEWDHCCWLRQRADPAVRGSHGQPACPGRRTRPLDLRSGPGTSDWKGMASWAWSRAGAAPRSAHHAVSPHCAHGLSAVPLQLLSGAEDSFVHVWKLSRSPDTDDVEVSVRHARAAGIPGRVTTGCCCPVGTTARGCGVTRPAVRGRSAEVLRGNPAGLSLSCCSGSAPPPVGTVLRFVLSWWGAGNEWCLGCKPASCSHVLLAQLRSSSCPVLRGDVFVGCRAEAARAVLT